jgi:acyl-CoA dehydrogenase
MRDLAAITLTIAQGCSSAGLIYAMHLSQIACIVRHARSSRVFTSYLEEVVERQLLLASATSEVGTSGDTRSSICALEQSGSGLRLVKDATTVSYGASADDLVITCRRDASAPAGDQLLVLCRDGSYSLELRGTWDTLGMRGTCSEPYLITADGPSVHVLPTPFAEIAAQSMVPYSHILWSAAWLGIAADAYTRASQFVRAEARRKPGTTPPAATRLADLATTLQMFRANVFTVADDFDAAGDDFESLTTMSWALRLNNLKVASSETVSRMVHESLQIIGVMGYKNDSKFSVARQYRDALSASLMISNDRILAKSASLLLVLKDDQA